jgi:hypothetical protein
MCLFLGATMFTFLSVGVWGTISTEAEDERLLFGVGGETVHMQPTIVLIYVV